MSVHLFVARSITVHGSRSKMVSQSTYPELRDKEFGPCGVSMGETTFVQKVGTVRPEGATMGRLYLCAAPNAGLMSEWPSTDKERSGTTPPRTSSRNQTCYCSTKELPKLYLTVDASDGLPK
jgi:hypothetical protein